MNSFTILLLPIVWSKVDFQPSIFQVIGETLPYDTIHQIRARLTEVAPNLTRYGLVEEANYFAQAAQLAAADKKAKAFATGSPVDVKVKTKPKYTRKWLNLFWILLNYR